MLKFITILSAFLMFCFIGWVIELIYRSSKTKKLVNPGFMQGCALPLYGSGGVILYLICSIDFGLLAEGWQITIKCIIGTILMTLIEYIAGLISLKVYHTRLWDYSKRRGNIQGLICPLFSFFWGVLTVIFYFLFQNTGVIDNLGKFIYENVGMILLLGVLFGIFLVDFASSLHLLTKIKDYAKKTGADIRFEEFKASIIEKSNRFKALIRTNRYIQNFIDRVETFKETHNLNNKDNSKLDTKEEDKNKDESVN